METNAIIYRNTEISTAVVGERECPLTPLLSLLATKWTTKILFHLYRMAEPVRYGQLQRLIGGVTQKELTKRLRELERLGYVERRSYPEIPPRVEYQLTKVGKSLAPHLKALHQWAEANYLIDF